MNPKPLAVLLALTLPLAACGNKGPLVRPSSAPLPPAPTSTAPPSDSTAPPAETTTPPADTTTPADAGHG
ncbi:MAG TPA: lipoprotein [Xanthomonadaceae bacterium]|nr:lipoprotein [Xanthomonadaceae bacterium]